MVGATADFFYKDPISDVNYSTSDTTWANHVLTCKFTRKAITGDSNDFEIKAGEAFDIAYGTGDVGNPITEWKNFKFGGTKQIVIGTDYYPINNPVEPSQGSKNLVLSLALFFALAVVLS